MSRHVKSILQLAFGLVVAGGLLYLAVRGANPGHFWDSLKSVDLTYLAPILLTVAAFYWIKAIRWSYLLAPLRPHEPLKARQIFPAMMIGFMGNNVLPAHLGEFVRMYVLGKQFSLSKTSVLSTIVLERVLDFLAIIGTFAVTLQFIPLSPDLELVRKGGYVIGGASLAAFLVFLAFVWQTERCLRIAEWTFRILPHRTRERGLHLLRLGIEGLYVLRNPRVFPLLVGLTLVHWSMNGLGLYLAAISFPTGQPVPILASFFLLSVCALGVTLPSAPGYVGTIQYCFVLALGVFGIQREPALAASLYSMFLGHVPVTLVGFYYLARLGLKLGSLRREAEEDREET